MTSQPGQTTGRTTPSVSVPRQRHRDVEEAGDWYGWIVFGALMMGMLGAFHAIAGLVALFDETYYVVGSTGLVVDVSYTTWGWVHLGLGVLAVAAAVGLLAGQMWARVTTVALAGLSAIVNLAFLAAFPVWTTIMIVLSVVVVYAVVAHGREVRTD